MRGCPRLRRRWRYRRRWGYRWRRRLSGRRRRRLRGRPCLGRRRRWRWRGRRREGVDPGNVPEVPHSPGAELGRAPASRYDYVRGGGSANGYRCSASSLVKASPGALHRLGGNLGGLVIPRRSCGPFFSRSRQRVHDARVLRTGDVPAWLSDCNQAPVFAYRHRLPEEVVRPPGCWTQDGCRRRHPSVVRFPEHIRRAVVAVAVLSRSHDDRVSVPAYRHHVAEFIACRTCLRRRSYHPREPVRESCRRGHRLRPSS